MNDDDPDHSGKTPICEIRGEASDDSAVRWSVESGTTVADSEPSRARSVIRPEAGSSADKNESERKSSLMENDVTVADFVDLFSFF